MPERVTGRAVPIPPGSMSPEAEARLRRIRGLSWLLDRSIPIGKYRIGLDGLFGLVPGVGDWAGAVVSLYVLYQGARLGMPRHVLMRMCGNILVEASVGTIPVIGDLFDFAWKANVRNVNLVEQHLQPNVKPRSLEHIWLSLLFFGLVLLTLISLLIYGMVKLLDALIANAS